MLVLCLMNYDKNRKLVLNRLSGISTIPDNIKLKEMNSISQSNSIMWDYIRISDNVLHATDDYYRFWYVLTDESYKVKFKLLKMCGRELNSFLPLCLYSIIGNMSNDIFPGEVITDPTQGASGNIYDVAS